MKALNLVEYTCTKEARDPKSASGVAIDSPKRMVLMAVFALFLLSAAIDGYTQDYFGYIYRMKTTETPVGGDGEWLQNSFALTGQHGLLFGTNHSHKMIIRGSNVGIGTLNPGYLLDVNGTANFVGPATFANFVGIGTTNPAARLHISGNGVNGTLRISPEFHGDESSIGFYDNPDGINDNAWIMGHRGWGNVSDFTIGYKAPNSNDEGLKFLIQPNGYVGIGTSTPGQMLDVLGTGRFSQKLISGSLGGGYDPFIDWANTRGLFVGHGSDNAFFGLKNRSGASGTDNEYNAVIYFGDDIEDDLEFYTYNSGEIMRLTGDGNLGIGTQDPVEKLEVAGNGQFSGRLMSGSLGIGDYSSFIDWSNTRGILVGSGSDNAFFGLKNRSGATGGENEFNAVIYFGDDLDDHLEFYTEDGGELMRLTGTGNLGIGTSTPEAKLDVAGNIRVHGIAEVKELHIDPTEVWADHVFAEDYRLKTLEEVEHFIEENKHLPDVPSAQEVSENGYNQSEVNAALLQKIEELTLYMIELEKRNDALGKEIMNLKANMKKKG